MKQSLKISVLETLLIMSCACVHAGVKIAPPCSRDINHAGVRYVFSTNLIDGRYNENTRVALLIFKQDLDNVEILIYKDGSVCEQEIESSVKESDFKEYLLSTYGKGNYTICVKVDGAVVVSEEIVL